MTALQTPLDFVRSREDVEGVIMHIGLNNTQVVLVAADGEWTRFVVPSMEAGREFCARLRITAHEGAYPDHLRQRMGGFKRTPEDWAAAPYPERNRS